MLSWILRFFFIGLVVVGIWYMVAFVIPFLLLIVFIGYFWKRYKQRNITGLDEISFNEKRPRGEIIDVEYEIIDDERTGRKQ